MRVDCCGNQIRELPNWERVGWVDCDQNQLETIPDWKNVKLVSCSDNQLQTLPKWKEVVDTRCQYNQIKVYPRYTNLRIIWEDEPAVENESIWNLKCLLCIRSLANSLYNGKITKIGRFLEPLNL